MCFLLTPTHGKEIFSSRTFVDQSLWASAMGELQDLLQNEVKTE